MNIVKVPIVGNANGESILLKDLIYNFVYDAGPIHAIDDMDNINENCNSMAGGHHVKPLLWLVILVNLVCVINV